MTTPSLGCGTCGVFSGKKQNTFCILHHLHPFVKERQKLHLFLILIFPSLPLLSSGIFKGTLYADFVKVKLHFQLHYNSLAELQRPSVLILCCSFSNSTNRSPFLPKHTLQPIVTPVHIW